MRISLFILTLKQIYNASFRVAISQKNMTTENQKNTDESCPAEGMLKMLSGKWKPQIYKQAMVAPLRFNTLLRQLPGSNKQSVAVALKEMEEAGILIKTVIQLKPLHIEYVLSEKGLTLIEIFKGIERLLPVDK